MRNEIVLEIDSDDWSEVRDGTKRIISLLEKWGANECYYLSYSGNRSIHVHVFIDMTSVQIYPEVVEIINGNHDIIPNVKSYICMQISKASRTSIDMGLTGNHLIRMEGGINEKSNKCCTQIRGIPEEKPEHYDVTVPSTLPQKFWNISFLEKEINAFLRIHYSQIKKVQYKPSGRQIDPEPLKEILKPVYIPGYRDSILLALSGWLMRHSVPEEKAIEIVKSLNPYDKTPRKTTDTIRRTYRTEERKTQGLPKLLEIINRIRNDGKISAEDALKIINALETIHRSIQPHKNK